MPEPTYHNLSGVPETSLIPLYLRAMESKRPDALMKDEKAEALVAQMSGDFERIRRLPLIDANKVIRIMLTREIDRYTRDFLRRFPASVVVHIGCGLDCRYERVDNGQVEWYDLDMPDIIELRRKYIGGETERYHLIGCSVFDKAWLTLVSAQRHRPFLFLAETVFVYFEAAQVKALVRMLLKNFPGAELVFDAWSPIHVWVSRLQLSSTEYGRLFHWGIWHGQELETWGDGIHLIDERSFFDQPEPRLGAMRRLSFLDAIFRTMRVYHFRLGEASH